MAARLKAKQPVKKRPQRATSNIFAMFDKSQIEEFKEAFHFIDQDHDGFISGDDLRDLFRSLGKDVPPTEIESMMREAPGDINFTMFLTMFGEKLTGSDPEDVVRNAFIALSEERTGKLSEEYLREILMSMGDRYTEEEADAFFKDAPIKNGFVDFEEFIKILKYGRKEQE